MTDDAADVCPICARDTNDEGECETHGDGNDWRKLGEERRTESIRAQQEDEE